MHIHTDTRVGQIVAEHPLATRVFARHGIDFCCGGGKPIEEVCHAKGLDTQEVLEEIEIELTGTELDAKRWDEAELDALIDHILVAYHAPLAEELPRLELMARKVFRVHGELEPEMLGELLAVFLDLKTELESHMLKEEQILFPMIRQGRGPQTAGPVAAMEQEHESAGEALQRLRELTNGYELPEGACNTWRALWHGLGDLEESLHQHIHLENNILFPRALAS
jgi:regulator of cell morphogenesis and NO signaling